VPCLPILITLCKGNKQNPLTKLDHQAREGVSSFVSHRRRRPPLYHIRLLQDRTFFEMLVRFDEDLAAEVHARGCPCGGCLHRAAYPMLTLTGIRCILDAAGKSLP
jgi:hypothetical protein